MATLQCFTRWFRYSHQHMHGILLQCCFREPCKSIHNNGFQGCFRYSSQSMHSTVLQGAFRHSTQRPHSTLSQDTLLCGTTLNMHDAGISNDVCLTMMCHMLPGLCMMNDSRNGFMIRSPIFIYLCPPSVFSMHSSLTSS